MRTTREPLKNSAKAERVALDYHQAALLRSRGEEPEVTLQEAFVRWVEAHALRLSPSHIENVDRCGRIHLGRLAGLPVSQVSTRLVEEELAVFLSDHKPSSANQWLAYIRLVLRWCIRRRMIRAVPFDVRETRIKRKPKILIPTNKAADWLAEVDALAEHEPSIAMVLRLMIGLGLRGSEARQARWEWLDLERELYIPGDTKGGEAWPRPVPPWILEELRAQHKPFGWMAPTLAGAPVTPGRVKRVFDAACKAAGIQRLVPHRLRATYATWLSEEGVPIQDIQAALAHKDIRTTAIYLGVDLGRVVAAQRRVAARTGLGGIKTGASQG